MKKLVLLSVIVFGLFSLSAQGYRHSMGAIRGMNSGFSYKGLFNNYFALQADLGYGVDCL